MWREQLPPPFRPRTTDDDDDDTTLSRIADNRVSRLAVLAGTESFPIPLY